MNEEIIREISITDDPEIIAPKVDYAFKQMMNNEVALRNFLSAVLKIPEKEISNIKYVDTHTLKEFEDDKYIVMDVRITVNNSYEIDIEMQVMNFIYWTDRALYYSCKMLIEQMKKGQSYDKFIKCVSISILDFNIFDRENYTDYYSSYHVTEDKDHRKFSDLLEFHIIELPKIPEKQMKSNELLMWARFINSENKEEMKMLSEKNIGIKAAYDELESLKNNEEKRKIYEARKKAIMDYNVQNRAAIEKGRQEGIKEGIKEGVEKGKKEGIIQTAKEMLNNGLNIELVSNITKLPKEVLETLK